MNRSAYGTSPAAAFGGRSFVRVQASPAAQQLQHCAAKFCLRVNEDSPFALKNRGNEKTPDIGASMADICVYYFSVRDRMTGKIVCTKRRATLEAIRFKGEPVMESQLVVDTSELDEGGFLVRSDVASHGDELWGEIRSLRLRAGSRQEQLQLEEEVKEDRRALLRAEITELRRRADRLEQLAYTRRDTAW
ncbi:MAG TPA: hypothetical protein VGI90_00075 [Steroidobacteraceae bacterium]